MIYDIVRYHDIYPNVPREKEGLLCCIRWRLVIDSRALVPCDYPPSTSNIANMRLSTVHLKYSKYVIIHHLPSSNIANIIAFHQMYVHFKEASDIPDPKSRIYRQRKSFENNLGGNPVFLSQAATLWYFCHGATLWLTASPWCGRGVIIQSHLFTLLTMIIISQVVIINPSLYPLRFVNWSKTGLL